VKREISRQERESYSHETERVRAQTAIHRRGESQKRKKKGKGPDKPGKERRVYHELLHIKAMTKRERGGTDFLIERKTRGMKRSEKRCRVRLARSEKEPSKDCEKYGHLTSLANWEGRLGIWGGSKGENRRASLGSKNSPYGRKSLIDTKRKKSWEMWQSRGFV